ncbi:LysR family transcriptional regulator [Shewanella sp. GutDb-MelDb]|uniref:LysR family transcriptional regulator n=1 Tax=Shewanella sp. GutDb-MelDb TaxID=2058316 RepID=UPI000C7D6E4A|nr:LysR family transcriptional regulator [Shewanella sp. GutDb-MelDb]PKG55421.1 LysR family transcriptional regulator [Shewanella sp. GutDb-MelDb]
MRNITIDNLDMLSINILVNLYEEHSATFVAKKMNIPAPKVSRCLQNARVIFNNPLFIRKKHGLIPNEFTQQLYPIAKELLQCSDHLQQLSVCAKDLSNSEINIYASDMLVQHLPQQLSSAINQSDLPISYKLHTQSINVFNDINNGVTDIAILTESNPQLLQFYANNLDIVPLQKLNHIYLVCDLHHPILKQELDIDTIASYPYVKAYNLATPTSVDPFIFYCQQHHIRCRLANIDNVDDSPSFHDLYPLLADSENLALLPYSKIYEQSNLLPGLHVCCLSEMETNRLYLSQSHPTLYLVRAKGNHSGNFDRLTEALSQIVTKSGHLYRHNQ